MREIRQSGSEGGARFNPLSLPLSGARSRGAPLIPQPDSQSAEYGVLSLRLTVTINSGKNIK